MARRWVVSSGTNAVEIFTAKVAIGGVVKSITKAACVELGIVREFFPTAAGYNDSRITWTADAITIKQTAVFNNPSSALINFNRSLGSYYYNNAPSADVTGIYLNPPVTGAGQYLIRCDQVSGDALTGTLATWIDINSLSEHEWSLDRSPEGTSNAVANISIAQDDGVGAPESATTVVKSCTFISEVTGAGFISWNSTQADLVEIKEGEDADCVLTFNPDGFAVGEADTSGAFTQSWYVNAPVVPNPEEYTVQFDLISGTTPTGTLGSPLTLDVSRAVTLLATTGEDLSCELDVTVDNLVPVGSGVTKRVTMNSVRSAAESSNVWTTALYN